MTHCPDCHQLLSLPAQPLAVVGRYKLWCATCDGQHQTGADPARATVQAENESTLSCVELDAHFRRP
ncbi:MAG: hypothetical protein RL456_2341 [Pseudomonadota bacterium]|jgi:hypothetical protein